MMNRHMSKYDRMGISWDEWETTTCHNMNGWTKEQSPHVIIGMDERMRSRHVSGGLIWTDGPKMNVFRWRRRTWEQVVTARGYPMKHERDRGDCVVCTGERRVTRMTRMRHPGVSGNVEKDPISKTISDQKNFRRFLFLLNVECSRGLSFLSFLPPPHIRVNDILLLHIYILCR